MDFKSYISHECTYFNVKGFNSIEPEFNIKITRYLKNKFIILLEFFADYTYDNNTYSGIIEFSFDLDEFLEI